MRGLTPEEECLLLRSVRTHRRKARKLSPVEVARLIQKAIDSGATRKECADGLQIGTTQVSAFLDLLKLAPDVQDLADWGGTSASGIPFSSLGQLAGLKEASEQVRAARAILASRLSWKEVVQLVQLKKRSAKSIEESVDAVLKLRPEVERRHLFVGSITDDGVRLTLSRLTQGERDEFLGRALRKVLGAREGCLGRLGTQRFTLVGPEEPARMVDLSPDAFEAALNEALREETRRNALSD
ncbi:MAG: hypothetical protein AAB403_11115 [Planctomycetota bacterium]